jgi:hypothetical protein
MAGGDKERHSLNGAGDFLFYEAVVPDSGWQKKEGFVIRAADREQDMASMLGHYGFNEKETVEFIDYWANNLLDNVETFIHHRFVSIPSGDIYPNLHTVGSKTRHDANLLTQIHPCDVS